MTNDPCTEYYNERDCFFNAQYTTTESDGPVAADRKILMYTIGAHSLDYYSIKGIGHSKNNLCSNMALRNGQFDLLKHAMRSYGKEHF